MAKNKIIDIDSEFEGLEDFFDERSIRQRTGARKKYQDDPLYNKKRKLSIQKIKARNIVTPFGNFNTVGEFNNGNFKNCTFNDCRRMMPHLYYYEDQGPGKPSYEDIVYTPYGIFPKNNQGNAQGSGGKDRAFQIAKEQGDPIALKYKDKYAWWNKVSTFYPKQYYIKNEMKKEWNNK